MSVGPSRNVDLPGQDSNTQSPTPFAFGPGINASARDPIQRPLTDHMQSSGAPVIGTTLPTTPRPHIQTFDPALSDERRSRLFDEAEDAYPGWPRIRECLDRLFSLTMTTLKEHNLQADLPRDFEIVAERMDPEVPEVFYFVSQSLRRVINYGYDCPCDANAPTHPPEQCPCPKLKLEKTSGTRFWTHLASYPMHVTALPPYAEADFLKALTQGANERILDERKSMFPYTDQQAQRFMQVYRDLKCVPYGQGQSSVLPALAWHVSRVMIKIEAVRERYRYGTKEARLYRDIAVEAPTWRERALDALLLCLFFNSHRTYRDRLAGTRPKGHVYLPDFRALMSGLLVEWSDSNLLATVFVSANAAFLAVPNITPFLQTASLCSILFSMLSLVIGVHHVWRHRRRADADEDEASQYLHVRSRSRSRSHGHALGGGLTLLACFLALPLAALLWAILSFTVAVGALCFSSAAGADAHTRGLFAGVLGVLLSLALLTLLVFWDAWRAPPTTEPEEDYARSVGVGARERRRRRRKGFEKEGWLRHARRRMRIVSGDVMDGMQATVRTVVRRALSLRRATNPTTLEDPDGGSTKEGLGTTEATNENTADV